jgi:hypothetical protein
MKQTAIQLLKESIDYEMKLGTKMVVNWDMYIEMEKEQRIMDYNAGHADGLCNHINDANNYINEQNYLKGENID